MGDQSKSLKLPINEAVNFLHRTKSDELLKFRKRYPILDEELNPGVFCGDEKYQKQYVKEKAEIVSKALKLASEATNRGVLKASKKIRWIDRFQTSSQILTLIGSSSVIGTIGMTDSIIHLCSAVITLLASCGGIFVEHMSKLASPEMGNIRDAYSALTSLSHKTISACQELELAIKYSLPEEKMVELIAEGNSVLNQVNEWNPQVYS